MNKLIFKRFLSIHSVKRPIVLGIETSCDDTAVAIVSADKKVLNSKVFVNRTDQQRIGGISPALSAMQHRMYIDQLIEQCLEEVPCRLADLDAIAVTSCPGLVICLKVGIERAISLARLSKVPLIQVHHMRAHALSSRLIDDSVEFPFLSLLISGGHCLLVLVKSPSEFDIIGMDSSTSPGECLDKIAREIGLKILQHRMYIDQLIEQCLEEVPCRLADLDAIAVTSCPGLVICLKVGIERAISLARISKMPLIQVHHMQAHALSSRLIDNSVEYPFLSLLISGGHCLLVLVKSPSEFDIIGLDSSTSPGECLDKIAREIGLKSKDQHFGAEVERLARLIPPGRLCTDNAEMIAWTAIEMMQENPNVAIPWTSLPSSIYAHDRYPIGTSNLRDEIHQSKFKPERKLKLQSLLQDQIYFTGKPLK
uniref:N(6)-L-threonylcarbamoyladenine synthase n=1 Tax=Panagrolaimus sp. ES5 TaxID=591445 RepID=A0AC34GTG5_9BILA